MLMTAWERWHSVDVFAAYISLCTFVLQSKRNIDFVIDAASKIVQFLESADGNNGI
jgi:hypothetical protein